MANDSIVLLYDAPSEPSSVLPLAPIGRFQHPTYGELEFTQQTAKEWNDNLQHLPGARALLDFDHLSEKPSPHRRTEAAGWFKNIRPNDEGTHIVADVEWTPRGETAVRNKEYLFTSPTYGPRTDEHGQRVENVCFGAGLTNKPHLGANMISLASPENLRLALERSPEARLYQLALDGELGERAKQIALDADGDDDTTEPDDDADDGADTAAKKKKGEAELDEIGPAALVMLDVSQAERDKAKEDNNSLPDGSYPINNTKQLKAAAVLAASKHGDYEAAKSLIRRRAKELGVDIGTLDGFGKKEMSANADIRAQMFSHDTIKSLASIAGISDEAEVQKLISLAGEKDADEAKVLAAIEAAKPAPKTLEDLAKESGVVTLSKGDHEKLTADAKDGAEAKRLLESQDDKGEPDTKTLEQLAAAEGVALISPDKLTELETAANKVTVLETAVGGLQKDLTERNKQLAAQTFDAKFDEALRKGKATPSQKESLEGFYELDSEATLKMLDEAPVVVNVRSIGKNVNPVADEVPEGVHAGHAELESKVRAYMGEHEVDYVKALEAITGIVVNA